jgi:inosine-uridine nucleoside N-ribohydrolase
MPKMFPAGFAAVWLFSGLVLVGMTLPSAGQSTGRGAAPAKPQLVWVDTDIGDDIDDAFALGLILRSPELKVVGISTAFGDTAMRSRIVDRFVAAMGMQTNLTSAGVRTETDNPMTQRAYGEQWPVGKVPDGVAAMLEAIRAHPSEITLIGLGPLFNVGAAIDRDPVTFRKLKRVVLMGGSIEHGYNGGKGEPTPAEPEWNIKQDPKGAAKLLASGVPVFMAPLDSTQIPLDEAERETIFAAGTPLTDQIALLYRQWVAHSWNHSQTPTLFDPLAAAYTFRPDLCPMRPMRIEVDPNGMTRRVEGKPNAEVCLQSDAAGFLKLLDGRLAK